MKSAMPYHGVAAPQVRALLRPLLRDHPMCDRAEWQATALRLWDEAEHREERYAALALLRHAAYAPWLDPDLLPLCGRWPPTTTSGSGARRCSASSGTASAPTPTCSTTPSSPTWTTPCSAGTSSHRLALGWASREHARTDAAWVLDLVGTHADRLSGLSRREALKHL
nr:DNA alkylation repair protein [Nocardioides currus]